MVDWFEQERECKHASFWKVETEKAWLQKKIHKISSFLPNRIVLKKNSSSILFSNRIQKRFRKFRFQDIKLNSREITFFNSKFVFQNRIAGSGIPPILKLIIECFKVVVLLSRIKIPSPNDSKSSQEIITKSAKSLKVNSPRTRKPTNRIEKHSKLKVSRILWNVLDSSPPQIESSPNPGIGSSKIYRIFFLFFLWFGFN